MFAKSKNNAKKVLIILVLVLVPLAAALTYKFQNSSTKTYLPKLTEQPKDTEVANKVLPIHHWVTKNGARVFFVPTENLPIVDVKVTFDAGATRDGQLYGISELALLSCKEGSVQHDGNSIAEEFDNAGAIFGITHGLDKAAFQLRMLTSGNIAMLTNLFAEVIATPSYTEDGIAIVKQQITTNLAREAEDPDSVAEKAFFNLMYGDHPYGANAKVTPEALAKLTRDDLIAFHSKYIVERNATITIVGGVHRDKARDLANAIVAPLAKGAPAEPIPTVTTTLSGIEKRIYFPSKQAHIYLGQPSTNRADPDNIALELGNYILGRDPFGSRLFKGIRESRGLAYDISSNLTPLQANGPFLINMQTKAEQSDAALANIKQILREFLQQGPTEEEFSHAKNYLIGGFPLKFISNAAILQEVSNLAYYGLPYDYFDNYVQNVQNSSTSAITAALARKIKPDNMALVIVGEHNS